MRRTIAMMAGALLSAVALGSDSPKDYGDATEQVAIEGTWRLTGATIDGDPHGIGRRPTFLTLHRGQLSYDAGFGHVLRGTYRAAPAGKRAEFDRFPNHGPFPCVANRCIYEIDGDTLRIGGIPDRSRGRAHTFHDEGIIVETYQRVK